MKCIASFVLLTISSVVSALARTKVGKYTSGYNYDLYSDGKTTIVGTYYDSIQDANIPVYISLKENNILFLKLQLMLLKEKILKNLQLEMLLV